MILPKSNLWILFNIQILPNTSIDVFITFNEESVSCPYCHGKVKSHGYYQKKLTHSTLANRSCTIYYKQRRYRCRHCEFTFHENNPFALPNEHLTYETKFNVLTDLKFSHITYTYVAQKYHISTTPVLRLFDKHVNIPRKPLPEVLSMDEHFFPESSFDSLYICILMDFKTGTLIDVLPDRKKDYLRHYFDTIYNTTLNTKTHSSELDNVRYISIDLYDNYRDISKLYFKHAKICANPFHVLKNLSDFFRNLRLRCRKQTQYEDMQYLLSKFNNIFNHNFYLDNPPKYNKRFKRRLNYRDILHMLFDRFPELETAYDLKEAYIEFNKTATLDNAAEQLETLIQAFEDSGIPEYIPFVTLLKNWRVEIINSFTCIDTRRINNSYIKSRNSIIENLLINANGFSNRKRTRNRILYCVNRMDTFKL